MIFSQTSTDVAIDPSTGELICRTWQDVPDTFFEDVRAVREDSCNHRMGDFVSMYRIDELHALKLYLNGWDVLKEASRDTVALLRRLGWERFITSNRQF